MLGREVWGLEYPKCTRNAFRDLLRWVPTHMHCCNITCAAGTRSMYRHMFSCQLAPFTGNIILLYSINYTLWVLRNVLTTSLMSGGGCP